MLCYYDLLWIAVEARILVLPGRDASSQIGKRKESPERSSRNTRKRRMNHGLEVQPLLDFKGFELGIKDLEGK